jgi:hypothetical protein
MAANELKRARDFTEVNEEYMNEQMKIGGRKSARERDAYIAGFSQAAALSGNPVAPDVITLCYDMRIKLIRERSGHGN